MYPLNMKLPAPGVGFAVANDQDEHKALSERGYGPAFVEPEGAVDPVEQEHAEKRKPGRPRKD